ncbi:UDP-glycosyltransferase 71E1 [Artemisia annua]|uniref:UDP-glycosyltransferase 71E1 n=1 Tax=Artemisia annua TaxID=35608 RepID=A0A2U1NKX7_ARTAN|nr:UDP-glycosyltransferase 71E1 [Artemisia annua]
MINGYRLSITIIIMNLPLQPKHNIITPKANFRLCFVDIPSKELTKGLITPNTYIHDFVEHHKTHVLNIVHEMVESGKIRHAGFVVDMFCVAMTDVANAFGVPTYIYFTSGAAMLGMMFYVHAKHDEGDITRFKDLDLRLPIPSYVNVVPVKILP